MDLKVPRFVKKDTKMLEGWNEKKEGRKGESEFPRKRKKAKEVGLQRSLELRNHLIFFLTHVAFEFRIGHRVVVLAFETTDHTAEILPHEFREQLRTGVAVADTAGFEDFIGEIGAGFEGEGFGEYECVVAVEEEGGYLGWGVSSGCGVEG
ncbi:hypothetical protein BCON_0292g00060 [Botryotinia convoluta]|uniref:Uncharacterized protein n=1 Tax=Botryotinia convoluta TaxID=54673 RepID=A0A4Z1HDL9_9HELO|nr:hypothetical protein BCON_0292g00060 [Botryotinia convoluta]